MNKTFHPQYITDEQGQRVSVVLPIQQWQQMLDELEELDDIRLYDEVKARKESTISLAEYRQKRVGSSWSVVAIGHRRKIYE